MDWPVQFRPIDCYVTCQLAVCMTSAPGRLLRRTDVSIRRRQARASTINKVVVTDLHNFQSASGRTGLRELERRERGRCSVLPGARADRCLRSVSWDGAFSVTATRRRAGACAPSKIEARTARAIYSDLERRGHSAAQEDDGKRN